MTKDAEQRFVLRLPLDLNERIRGAADRNRRSINAEILVRLEESLRDDDQPTRKEAIPMKMTFAEINDCTGFANGDEFTSDEQVIDYFTVGNMNYMFPGDEPPTQDQLDEMAAAVIDNRWHYSE